jgi:hypothetical protein
VLDNLTDKIWPLLLGRRMTNKGSMKNYYKSRKSGTAVKKITVTKKIVLYTYVMKEKAMTEMPTFSAYVLPLLLHSLPPQFLGWIFIIFSFELEQGFRGSFRFCENISRTLKVSRGRNKSSHFHEPFGFS